MKRVTHFAVTGNLMSCRLMYGDSPIQASINAVSRLDKPAIQFSLGTLAIFLRIDALPQVVRNRNVTDRVHLAKNCEPNS